MAVSFLTNLNEEEFKIFLKQAISEIMDERTAHSKPDTPDILDVEQAAIFLRYKVNTIYEKTSEKTIPHFKKGGKLFFHRSELEAWVMEGKVKTTDELQSEAATYTMRKKLKR
jgi:excisionase family DNA binding protein